MLKCILFFLTNLSNSKLGKIDFEKRKVIYSFNQKEFVLEIKDALIQEIFSSIENIDDSMIENIRRNLLIILSIAGLYATSIERIYNNYLKDLEEQDEKAKLNAIKNALDSILSCFYINERRFIHVNMYAKISFIIEAFILRSKQVEKFESNMIFDFNYMNNVLCKIKGNKDIDQIDSNLKIFDFVK